MTESVFVKLIDMSMEAGIVILIVMLARLLLKKFPKIISYALWGAVLFRLFCPVSFESGISPVPNLATLFHEYDEHIQTEEIGAGADDSNGTASDAGPENRHDPEAVSLDDMQAVDLTGGHMPGAQPADAYVGTYPDGVQTPLISASDDKMTDRTESVTPVKTGETAGSSNYSLRRRLIFVGKYVWIAGCAFMLLSGVISARRIRRRIAVSVPLRENIYIADEGISPFVMGVFKPRIYLPDGLSQNEQEYIILHEQYHIRRLDHMWRLAAYAALCMHWFNPLVWLAFFLSGKDMEMSCDEAVIRRMGEDIRADYAKSLLSLSAPGRIMRGIPLGFGESSAKGRIKNLAAFRRTKKSVWIVLSIAAVALVLCLISNRKISGTDAQNDMMDTAGEQEDLTPEQENPEPGNSGQENPEQGNPEQENTEQGKSEQENPEQGESAQIQEEQPVTGSRGPAELFADVFRNKEIICCYQLKGIGYSEFLGLEKTGYLKECIASVFDYSQEYIDQVMAKSEFAIVDLDGDEIPEVILNFNNYFFYLIFHYSQGQISCNMFPPKQMGMFKVTGAYYDVYGAFGSAIGKCYYIGDAIVHSFEVQEEWKKKSPTAEYYPVFYIHDLPIDDSDTGKDYFDRYYKLPDVEWHAYTEEAICEWIERNPLFTELPEEALTVSERQRYQDSLSYLIELTYNFDEDSKNVEKMEQQAKEYYDACGDELERFVGIYRETLSGEALKAFDREQEYWEKTNAKMLDEMGTQGWKQAWAYAYLLGGDRRLRRILRLANLYYGCSFYDSLYDLHA